MMAEKEVNEFYIALDEYLDDVLWGGELAQVDLYEDGEAMFHKGPYYHGSQTVLYLYSLDKTDFEEHFGKEFAYLQGKDNLYVVQIADMIDSNEIEGVYETKEQALKEMNVYRKWFRMEYNLEK